MCIKLLSEIKVFKYFKDNLVVFKDVLFCYKDVKENVLNYILFKINLGEYVVFVGLFGGGKIILVSVIVCFWDVDSGEVRIGNVNVKDILKEELMNNVLFVF